VLLAGRSISALDEPARARLRRDTLGLVFQQFHLVPSLNVLDNLRLQARLAGRETPEWSAHLMQRLGLDGMERRYPEQLSGGQQQRLAIGRALAPRPALLLADEPTGNLDETTAGEVLALLRELVSEAGSALLMVTHSAQVAAPLDRCLRLTHGRLGVRCRTSTGAEPPLMFTAFATLLSHYKRHPGQLAMLLLGLWVASALWSGVQAINASARDSYARAEALFTTGLDRLERRDGEPLTRDDYLRLRRAGLPVSPLLEGTLEAPDGTRLTVIGIEPFTLPGDSDFAAAGHCRRAHRLSHPAVADPCRHGYPAGAGCEPPRGPRRRAAPGRGPAAAADPGPHAAPRYPGDGHRRRRGATRKRRAHHPPGHRPRGA
jgi:ABC-type lipoprotein export system ATPase subunit